MSEQPPRASGHLPVTPESAPHRFDPDPEAPPMESGAQGDAARTVGEPPVSAETREARNAFAPLPADPEERIRVRAGEGLDRVADAARRLGHRVHDQGGVAAQAEPIAYRVGDTLQGAASYVREHDLAEMRDDVELGVRRSPIRALAVAAIGGFLLGRLIR